jgi:large subunit ribosomal protein L14e
LSSSYIYIHRERYIETTSQPSSYKIIMVFTRFVEIGRVCLITYGKQEGKLCVIVDVLDQNRALVDGPEIPRMKINFRRVSLTDIKMDITRSTKTGKLNTAWKEQDVDKKWNATSWAKKRAAKTKRANLSDFQRFKAMVLRKKVCLSDYISILAFFLSFYFFSFFSRLYVVEKKRSSLLSTISVFGQE